MLKVFGVQTICECTGAYFGRRVDLLRRISRETGMQILTNTGYLAQRTTAMCQRTPLKKQLIKLPNAGSMNGKTGLTAQIFARDLSKLALTPACPLT